MNKISGSADELILTCRFCLTLESPHFGVTQRRASLTGTHDIFWQCLVLETEGLVSSKKNLLPLGIQASPRIELHFAQRSILVHLTSNQKQHNCNCQ